ncbi:glycosyltransferase family 4 protein [Tardiphaga sp. 839_C3_N1_4]|uniref:glycosyltransferase family 4 protein n=1 Tax=Tardiphaga sp. 839_C3_N1_4 TaxID=3240761 RepID=UPI003F1F101F
MALERTIKVGIEMRVMAGPMTGIGNYSFHLIQALLKDEPRLHFSGFGLTSWLSLDAGELDRLSASKEAARASKPAAKGIGRLRNLAVEKLRQSKLAPAIYRAQFVRTVKRQSFDLFHAFNFLPFADPGVVTLPVVYDLSFVRYPHTHPRERLRRLERLPQFLEDAPLVQTISEFSRDEITSVFGCPKDKIIVAPPAASDIFRPLGPEIVQSQLAQMGITGDYFLAVGTLEPRKNLRTLIQAFGRLSKTERAAAPLLIVGGGGWGALELPPETEALRSEGSLRFLGTVSNAELRTLYEGALALMFPSIYEGFGMPVVEAMACGTRVVHSSGTSMDEISDGLAIKVGALDIDAWTAAFRALTDSSEATLDGSTALRARAAHFDWHRSAARIKDAYTTLVNT